MTRKLLVKRLFLLVLLFAALALPVSARRAAAQCSPPECSPPEPPYEPPPSGGGGSWTGYHDGRLNPSPDEYYSIWCRNDLIEVWGGQPTPQLIANIPMVDVLALGDVGSLSPGYGLTLSRAGDVVVISGSNGNSGSPGSKVFSLTACTNANGGAPELPPPPPPANPPSAEENPPSPPGADEGISDAAFCLPGAQSTGEFIDCLTFFAPDDASAGYYYSIVWAIITFCSGGFAPFALVAAVPVFRLWQRRRGR